MDKYRAEESRYLRYCGTKKYRKGDGTGRPTVEKWYRGAAVVPWYRATLLVTCCFGPRNGSPMATNVVVVVLLLLLLGVVVIIIIFYQ